MLSTSSEGVFAPRGGLNNRQLPSARLVSISNIADVDVPDTMLTLSVMQWGQFIDHDLTHTPIFRLGQFHCMNLNTFLS